MRQSMATFTISKITLTKYFKYHSENQLKILYFNLLLFVVKSQTKFLVIVELGNWNIGSV